jgi:hypothetical protein
MASRPALYRGKAVRAIMGRFTATQSPWPSLHPTDYRVDTPGPRSVFAVFQLHYQTSIYTVPYLYATTSSHVGPEDVASVSVAATPGLMKERERASQAPRSCSGPDG